MSFSHIQFSPWVFLFIGVSATQKNKKAAKQAAKQAADNASPEGQGSNQKLVIGLERASRCSAGTHNCHENAVCTFRRGEFVSYNIIKHYYLKLDGKRKY